MATEQDHLDDLFRKRFETADIPFDHENWKKVETLLQYEDRKRRRKIFIFIFLTAMVALLISLQFFERPHGKKQIPSQQVAITNSAKPYSPQNADHSIQDLNSLQKAASDSLNFRTNPAAKVMVRPNEGEHKMNKSVHIGETNVISSSPENQNAINQINLVKETEETSS